MSATKKCFVWLLAGILIVLSVSCGPSGDSAAEQTLQAIYAEETAQAEAAANAAMEEEPAEAPAAPEEPTKVPLMVPGEPPEPERTLEDTISSYYAYENRATAGDNFLNGLYERPFTSQEMVYQPDLDITIVDFANDEDFFYFTINLYDLKPDEPALTGTYGVEFDRTKTGRGDLIVWVTSPQEEWSVENVTVYADENVDVGGLKPVIAEAGFEGDGYDTTVDPEGDKAAFARLAPGDPEAVQIAVSRSLLDDPQEFLWGAWADNGLKNAAMFDYNDTMGPSEAGSPIRGEDYPLNALYNLDNTCRLPYGLPQMGSSFRGMCLSIPAAPPPEPGQPACQMVCVQSSPRVGCVAWACQ